MSIDETLRRRELKAEMKKNETAEEKRVRRLAKKQTKAQHRLEKAGWDEESLKFSNEDNPFGDQHLTELFWWQKKLEKEGKADLSKHEFEKMQRRKMEDSKVELESVKERRKQREREMEEREREREMLQRSKESEYYRQWESQEDNFHLEQALVRSRIRIEDGRAKPIDLLARYISAEDDINVEMHEPYTYLNGLTVEDLDDLLEDIQVYENLEQGRNAEYWQDLIVITRDELQKLHKMSAGSQEKGDRRDGINHVIQDDVTKTFKGKTYDQLILLRKRIEFKLKDSEVKAVDVDYWESLLQLLHAHMAKQRLRERHQEVLRRKLFALKQEQGIKHEPLFPIYDNEPSSDSPGPAYRSADVEMKQIHPDPSLVEDDGGQDVVLSEEDLLQQRRDDYIEGCYSPVLLSVDDLTLDDVIMQEEDDLKKLKFARDQVLVKGKVQLDTETEFERQARENMSQDEAQFSVQVPLATQQFLWADKYRPRKPRFFNRVHTGFEWNKYNQTHYDVDNPPPKVVQGYKFNIFYPDLINKANTPYYTLTVEDDSTEFATLRFIAGPPYEDIAFRVVNKDWERSWKHGFRCQFQNNIFQLWFHFRRLRYRR